MAIDCYAFSSEGHPSLQIAGSFYKGTVSVS